MNGGVWNNVDIDYEWNKYVFVFSKEWKIIDSQDNLKKKKVCFVLIKQKG